MSSPPFRLRTLGAVGCVAALVALAACSSSGSSGSASSNSNSGTVTVAVVSNPLITGQMIPLTTSIFEKQYPGITVKFATYTEGDLRAAIEKDVATHSNAFNVIMIGPYETPLFAKNGWLTNLSTQYIASDPSYDAGDLLPPIAKSLSYKGDLYAVPFYGESSMMFYNKALFAQAGLTMPAHPDLDADPDLRGQAEPARQGVGDLPARPGRLGRQHGGPRHGGQHVRRRVVQHELAASAHLAGVRERDQLLRQPGPQVRRARRRPTTASTSC